MVLHFRARVGLYYPDLSSRIHPKANGESMEDLRETVRCANGFEWTYKRFIGISQLSSSAHVQIHKGE